MKLDDDDRGARIALNSSSLQAKARNRLKSNRVFSLLETHTRTRFIVVLGVEDDDEDVEEDEEDPERGVGCCSCGCCCKEDDICDDEDLAELYLRPADDEERPVPRLLHWDCCCCALLDVLDELWSPLEFDVLKVEDG